MWSAKCLHRSIVTRARAPRQVVDRVAVADDLAEGVFFEHPINQQVRPPARAVYLQHDIAGRPRRLAQSLIHTKQKSKASQTAPL